MATFTLYTYGNLGREEPVRWWQTFEDEPHQCSACGASITAGWAMVANRRTRREPPVYVCDSHVRRIEQAPHWGCCVE